MSALNSKKDARINAVLKRQIAAYRAEVETDQVRTLDWLWEDAFCPLALRAYTDQLSIYVSTRHPDLRIAPCHYVLNGVQKRRRCLYYADRDRVVRILGLNPQCPDQPLS
jgi:hypothetical protein